MMTIHFHFAGEVVLGCAVANLDLGNVTAGERNDASASATDAKMGIALSSPAASRSPRTLGLGSPNTIRCPHWVKS